MKRKYFVCFYLLLFLFFLNLSAKKRDKYEQWIKEEVNLIITKTEKAEFKKLKKEKDKEFFIKLFWAKRDPTPLTENNELREEYYQRLKYIKKAFLYGYKTGTATDMGKVYLYFGEPKVLHPGKSASITGENFPTEMWIYPAQPWMNLPKKTFSIVFSHDGLGYVIDRSQTDSRVMQAFYSYPKKILLYPELKTLPQWKKLIAFSPDSFEGKLIHQLTSTQENIIQIPFEKKALFIKAESRSSYLAFLLKIDPGEKKEAFQEKLVFFGRLESEANSYDFRQEKALIKENNHFITQVGLPVMPGEFKLILGFSTRDQKTYSVKMDQIIVPDFWNQELAISSLFSSSQVQEKKASTKKGEFDVFSLGRYSLLPCFEQEYTQEESLNVFYYIYNIESDENQNCSLLIEFELQKGEKRLQMNPVKKQQKITESRSLLEGIKIPVSALPGPGEYELTVRVTDEIAEKTAIQKLKFSRLE